MFLFGWNWENSKACTVQSVLKEKNSGTVQNLSSVHHKHKLCQSSQNKQFIQNCFTQVFQFWFDFYLVFQNFQNLTRIILRYTLFFIWKQKNFSSNVQLMWWNIIFSRYLILLLKRLFFPSSDSSLVQQCKVPLVYIEDIKLGLT